MSQYLYDDFNSGLDTDKWNVTGNVSTSGNKLVIAVGTGGWNHDGVTSKTSSSRVAGDTFQAEIKGTSGFGIGFLSSQTLDYYDDPGLTFVFNNSNLHIEYYLDGSGPTYTGYDWATNTTYTFIIEFKSGGGWTVTIDGGAHSNQVILDTSSGDGSTYYLMMQKLYGTMTIDNVYLPGSGGGGGLSIPVAYHHNQNQGIT